MDVEYLCGNIYCDKFYFKGRTYYNYSIDCAICGIEVTLDLGGKRTRTVALQMGWNKKMGKWVCPECCNVTSFSFP